MSNDIDKTKKELNKNNILDVTIDESLGNLYIILLQYYTTLVKSNHPKIHLITELLDLLIKIKKYNLPELQLREVFDEAHSKAFKNIQLIYEYDKENEVRPRTNSIDETHQTMEL
jgi:hypothetical protein